MTPDEAHAVFAEKLDRYGWTAVQVEPSLLSRGWTYSIGLTAVGHPEVVISGASVRTMYAILAEVCGRVLASERFGPGTELEVLGGHRMQVVPVHPNQLRNGLIGQAEAFFGPRIEAIQLLPLDERGWMVERFDASGSIRPVPPRDRAARRRMAREEARRRRRATRPG